MPYEFVFQAVMPYLPNYLRGLVVSVRLTIVSIAIGSVLGMVTAVFRRSGVRILNLIAELYIDFIRGIPLLVILLWLYFGLPIVTRLSINTEVAAITSLSIYIGAYLAETFRSGLQSVHLGQRESALSLGLSETQAFRYIVLPQAVRVVIPPFGNSLIGLLKDTSLVAVIAMPELLREAQYVATATLRTFESYTVAAAIYLIMTTVLTIGLKLVERKLRTTP